MFRDTFSNMENKSYDNPLLNYRIVDFHISVMMIEHPHLTMHLSS